MPPVAPLLNLPPVTPESPMPAGSFSPPAGTALAVHMPVRLTIREACALSGLSRYMLEDKIRKGELEVWKPSPRSTMLRLDQLAPLLPPEVRSVLPSDADATSVRKALSRILGRAASAQHVEAVTA